VLLSDKRIMEELTAGTSSSNRSIHVSSAPTHTIAGSASGFQPTKYLEVIDFTDEEQARSFWGEPRRAEGTIVVKPGTTILAHTQEVIGATNGYTTTMHAKQYWSLRVVGLQVRRRGRRWVYIPLDHGDQQPYDLQHRPARRAAHLSDQVRLRGRNAQGISG
jgi:hypothetical protein